MEPKRRPGRPATGQTPTRSVRIGSIWDRAREIAEQRGEGISTVIERALEDYVMDTIAIPPLSDGTRAAIANLVEYEIEREYGHDVKAAAAGARMIALGGLQLDLRADYLARTGDESQFSGYVDSTLRILIRDGLAERACQNRKLNPTALPCRNHYEADVPPIDGALLCGTHHIAEYEARN